MSLVSRVSAGFAAVRDKINLMTPRLLPAGGSSGQVLAKTSASDYATAWTTPAAGGGSTGRSIDGGGADPEPRSGSIDGGTA